MEERVSKIIERDYVKMSNLDRYQENRGEWQNLYNYFFNREQDYIDNLSIMEIILFISSILEILLKENKTINQVVFSNIFLVFYIFPTIFTYIFIERGKKFRNLGELGRRNSFYINIVEFSQLRPIIDKLRKYSTIENKKVEEWYYNIEELNEKHRKLVAKDLLHSLFYQNRLMFYAKKDNIKILIWKIILIITYIFTIIMVFENIIDFLKPLLIILGGLLIRYMIDGYKIIKFIQNNNSIEKLQRELEKILELHFKKKSFHFKALNECLRINMEYSVILINMKGISRNIYKKYRNMIEEDCKDYLEDIFK